MSNKIKLLAFYYPQFHAIPENDKWWGKGFTDWVNVKAAKQYFEGHNQPRVPLDDNYYDLSKIETIQWQIEQAKKYGISGFCHYHYWFDGVQMLETPTNIFLDSKNIDFPFCLTWANETWSKRWDGQNHYILQKQTHEPTEEKWLQHFEYLIKAWTDKRAIKIDNKPVFIIYRPHYIERVGEMLEYWNRKAQEHGLDGIYFIAMKQYPFPEPSDYLKHFDAVIHFQPFEAIYSLNIEKSFISKALTATYNHIIPGKLQKPVSVQLFNFKKLFSKPKHFDYDTIWEQILINSMKEYDLTTYPGAFIDWDNTARYKNRSTVFDNANPTRFEHWLTKLAKAVQEKHQEPLIFINAWNEWAEGTYLEPDEKYKYGYLDAISNTINNVS